ncbi:two-partner secretion domain-containing protein, partial [Phascolarctobacterium succinatutens]
MKQKDSLNKRLNTRLASLVMLSVLSVPWVASAAGNSVVANNMLPGNGTAGNVVAGHIEGGFKGSWAQGNQMNLHQTTQNAIVTWDSFSIGANATVTIRGDHDNFNMLNYVTGSESSQIYGKLNSYVGDKQGGNIYLVNPNGVQIGNSAEINVGSLHIANKKIDNINTWNENTDIAKALKQNKAMTNAELMSLGYINANKLVFEGERVVIDMDRLSGLDTTKADALTIVTQPYDGESVGDNRKYDVVLGSSTPKNAQEWGKYIGFADNGTGDRWKGTDKVGNPDASDQTITEFFTYRWIKDGKELEKIGKETDWGMGDNYALRYSIDLTGSDQTPIGTTEENAFKGKFDGLDNSIFGLSIDNSDNSKGKATGLFGFTDGAIMGNVTLIAGNDGVSIQGGNTDTGAFIGHAVNTTVKGVNSTLKVSGKNNVGGIIGYAEGNRKLTYNFGDASGSVQPDS